MKQLFVWALSGLFGLSATAYGQRIELLRDSGTSSFRGLSVPDDQTVWVSGSQGTVGRSTDGGKTWLFRQIPGYERTDFRDIEALDSNRALVMGIDCPARMLRTTNGGQTWSLIFEDTTKGMFMDAMDLHESGMGMVIGDPIGGRMFSLFFATDQSDLSKADRSFRPALDSGEAFFASSGSNLRWFDRGQEGTEDVYFVTGGLRSRLFSVNRGSISELPLLKGKESTGANAMALNPYQQIMVVGGDFMNKDTTAGNCCFSYTGGASWVTPDVPPGGYRSGVEYWEARSWITCGLNGVDLTTNDGRTFRSISRTGFHVVKKSRKGKAIFLAGGKGRIARWVP